MTSIPTSPRKVTRLRDADYAECKDCGNIITPGLYWQLTNSIWIHQSGTNHGGVNLYAHQ